MLRPVRLHKPAMTAAEFNSALREAGFGVDHGRVVDVSGKCPGFATFPAFQTMSWREITVMLLAAVVGAAALSAAFAMVAHWFP